MARQFINTDTNKVILEETSEFYTLPPMNKLVVIDDEYYITTSFDIDDGHLKIFIMPAIGDDDEGT